MQTNTINTPFSHLLGQPRAVSLLTRALHSGRIGHAYLFRGPSGVGKKLFAAAMAMALNCRNAGPSGACRECVSCRKYLSGNHPDYVVETPEKGAIKIGQIREICKSLAYPPYESERRIVVLEEVHTMRPEAANSLLKTLEEPPEGNVLILTAETSRSILSTIRSRCQIVPFFTLTQDETVKILEEKHDIEGQESNLLARVSEGSPGQALIFHRTGMLEIWHEVVGVLSDERFKDDRHSGELLQLAQKMADLKENLLPLLGLLRIWLRDLLVDYTASVEQKNQQMSEVGTIFTKLEAVNRAEQELARNCNRALVCEILLFRLQ